MSRFALVFAFLLCCTPQLYAQLVPMAANTAAERDAAINSLVGEGITIDPAISVDCGSNTFGIYQFNGSLLGFEEGIMLTTGDVNNAPGPNNNGGLGSPSDGGPNGFAELEDLSDVPLQDFCVVTFTLTPAGDEMSFDYVWASEEYPEYVCTQFNDIFAFFISGPNPAGGNYVNENIAVLEMTNEPVSIGTINNGQDGVGNGCPDGSGCPCNPIYYVNNPDTDSDIQYDGFTKVLTAKAATIPCEAYELTLAIADGSDTAFDSAIFLGANSLNSPAIGLETVSEHQIDGNQVGLEGCIDASIIVDYEFDTSTDVNLFYELTYLGEPNVATPGEDYEVVIGGNNVTGNTGSILFQPGAQTQTVEFVITNDNVPEGTELIIFEIVGSDFCSEIQGVADTLFVYEEINAQAQFDFLDACPGDPIPLSIIPLISTAPVSYEWSPAALISTDPNLSAATGNPTESTVFECEVTLSDCTEVVTVTVEFGDPPPYSDEVYPICDTATGGVLLDQFAPNPSFIFTWIPATNLDDASIAQPTYTGSGAATYEVLIGTADPAFCNSSVMVDIQPLTAGSFDAGDDASACISINEQIGPPSATGFSYEWSPIDGLSDPNIAQPTVSLTNTSGMDEFYDYTLTITDPSGCSASDDVQVAVLSNLDITGETEVFAFVNESATIEVLGGSPTAVYTWTPNQFLASATGATNTVTIDDSSVGSITYNVDVIDEDGCTGSHEVTVTVSTRATVALPSAFSPNGDNTNDILLLQTSQVDEILDWRIFNRWGNIVFESDGDLNNGWDGSYNGKPQDIGVYSYVVTYRGFASDVGTIKGQVTLLK